MSAAHLDPSRWRRLAARALPLVLVAGTVLAAPAQAAAADPVDGAQTAGDAMFPHVGNGGYDALHYDVDLAWQANGVVSNAMTGELTSASTTMRARTTGAPLRSFSLDFEGLQVDSVFVNGTAANFERVQDAAQVKFKLVVTPLEPVEGEFTTKVTYHGVPSRHVDADGSFEGWNETADGATFLGQPVGAMAGYPHNNTPGDKATYTFSLDVPSTITSASGTGPAAAVSNGELEAKTVSSDGTRTTWEWVQREQMASELALVSIGKYDVIESEVTLTGGRVIPEWSFMDSGLSATNKTTITNRRALLGDFLRRLERIYGPYPGNSTGVVIDTVPSGVNYALETQDRSFFPTASSVNGNTLIHELVHQWYGNNVSPGQWTDIWINEGMGTWGPTYHNQVLAPTTPNPGAVETTYFNSWNATASTSADWRTPPGSQTDSSDLYGYQTYTRGAQFWEALRTVLRDDDFLEVVRQWQTRYAGTSPRADRLKELAEEISGHDLDAFWQDWILDGDKPAWPGKYDVSLTSGSGEGTVPAGVETTLTLRAANSGKVALANAAVTVDVGDAIAGGTLGALPAGVTREGDVLTWSVPTTAVGASATTDLTLTTNIASDGVRMSAAPATLGGACAACGVTVAGPEPTVTGTPVVGGTLQAQPGQWPEGTALSHQWLVGGVAREGATDTTFSPVPGDVGERVTVAVTGVVPGSSPVRRVSAPTAPVERAALESTPIPTLSGTPRVGVPVSVVPGDWDESVSLAYAWFVGDESVGEGASYTPVAADAGKPLTVAVTGSKDGYVSVTRTSEVREVAQGELSSSVPTLDGRPRVGAKVSVVPGDWDDSVSLAYEWFVADESVSTGDSYTPAVADAGKPLTVEVTGTKDGYVTVTRTSVPVDVALGALTATPTPTITGAARYGATLRAHAGTWDEGVTVAAYQWRRDGAAIPGARSATYRPGVADIGKRITVRVAGTKAGYETVSKVSAPTARISRAVLPRGTVRVTGTTVVGRVLTARASGFGAGTKVTYRWYVGGKRVGTAKQLRLKQSYVGKRVAYRVTITKPGHVTVSKAGKVTKKVRARR